MTHVHSRCGIFTCCTCLTEGECSIMSAAGLLIVIARGYKVSRSVSGTCAVLDRLITLEGNAVG